MNAYDEKGIKEANFRNLYLGELASNIINLSNIDNCCSIRYRHSAREHKNLVSNAVTDILKRQREYRKRKHDNP